MNRSYSIEDHNHRLAAWAASRAASTSKLCRFKVEKGITLLESTGFDENLASPSSLLSPEDLDGCHHDWRKSVITQAKKNGLCFTHGVAAKLINCYLKVRFICGGYHEHERVQCLHPPLDEVLFKSLAAHDFGGHARQWRKFRQQRWSKFDSETYEDAIRIIRESLGNAPLWKIEEFWRGHQ